MEQLLSSMLGPIARGLRDTNAFGNSGDIYTDTQYRGGPITMPAPSGGGFAANYTPIRFAPLVSLTGPVMAPTAPAAPKAAAPLIRPPMMMDQAGSYEALPTYQGPPIGERLATPEGRAAEFQNLSRAANALMSPFTTIPSLALTGRTPMELMAQAMGIGGAQSAQATPQNPFGNFFDWFARNVYGPEEVPLYETRAPLEQATPVSASDIQLQDLASALGVSLPEAAAILGGQPATAPAGPVSTIGMDMFGPQAESSYSPSDFSGYGGGTAGETGAPGESSYGLDR